MYTPGKDILIVCPGTQALLQRQGLLDIHFAIFRPPD